MNNVGANTHRNNNRTQAGRPAVDDFGFAVSRIAVGRICETVGFESFRDSALNSFADIAFRYLRDLGKAAGFYANLAGRTECNVFDILRALEDLNFQGFSGASVVSNCITSSGMVREIMEYVETAEEIPFAYQLPRFPVSRERRMVPCFDHMGETPPANHIPSWLPTLPDPHTYRQSPPWNDRKSDLRAVKLEQVRQRRKTERPLLNLQQRLSTYGPVGRPTNSDYVPAENAQGTQVVERNPFLVSPLVAGDTDISVVNPPDLPWGGPMNDNRVSVFEAFTPAIEAVRDRLSDEANGDGMCKVLPEKRPAVQFKFKLSKKVLGHSLDLVLRDGNLGKPVSVIVHEEERNDKMGRAEYILRQSTENPQELTQF
ncbi:hypothetical protein SAY87_027974 [Trapa incisa]|uniref:Transcription initiation factor TFIID subunit 8 n=1 Tax=Trapa incisa TaxID=236973 RepID=A0AAN7QRM4_9MYRT|nr:hypothetical protein SAY87_027974 [Trapa incisa]